MVEHSDETIVQAILKGNDSNVLSFLYQSVLPKVRNHILRNKGTIEEANDIFQDAVLILYNRVLEGKFENTPNVRGFIIHASKNLWINRVKRLNKFDSHEINNEDFVEDKTVIDDIITSEQATAIRTLFNMVGEKCKQLLTYSIYLNMSMEEIASKLELPNANAAKTQNYRCKQKLADLVEKHKDLKANLLD